ncbi:hypothetical protein GOV10_04735 [Candidatus Woesearchaeota archaeon]|nr:hypothetical protein [Candidatus Woesearchaeota archaeon]
MKGLMALMAAAVISVSATSSAPENNSEIDIFSPEIIQSLPKQEQYMYERLPFDGLKRMYFDHEALVAEVTRRLPEEDEPYKLTKDLEVAYKDIGELTNGQLMRILLFQKMARYPKFIDELGGYVSDAMEETDSEHGGIILMRNSLHFVHLRNEGRGNHPCFAISESSTTYSIGNSDGSYGMPEEFKDVERLFSFHVHDNCFPGASQHRPIDAESSGGDVSYAWHKVKRESKPLHEMILNNTPEGKLNVTYLMARLVDEEPLVQVLDLGTYTPSESIACDPPFSFYSKEIR